MKKRLVSAAVALVMVVNLVFVPDGATVFTAGAATDGDWEYTENSDGTATVTKYNGTKTSVDIPSTVGGKKVTSIEGEYDYYGGTVFDISVTSVTIPSSVTSIGNYAFYSSGLTSITIPNSVTSIGDTAFDGANPTSITIGSGITDVSNLPLYGSNLKKITVSSSNKKFSSDNGVLFNKAKTTLLRYPSGKTSTSYTVPNSVKTIDENAFYEAGTKLTSITIGSGVTSIGSYVFYDCANLKSVVFKSKTPPTFWTNAFYGCTNLKTIGVPKGAEAAYQKALSDYDFLINAYNITYKLNGGKNNSSNPSTYTYGKSTSLKKPTRSGYAFAGWYTKESLSSSSKVTSISKTSAGNVTLYAKWVKLPAKTKSVSATANSKSKITVTWKKVSGADGYEVYRATSKDGKYKKVKTVSKGATVKYANKSLKANKKYYYKVRAYKLVDGKKVYGEYSAVKSATTKK